MSKNPARNYAIEWVQGKVVTEADALAIAIAAVIAGPPDTGDPIGDVVDTDLPLIEHLPTEETDDTLVLAPDGVGGVLFRAETGTGGSLPWFNVVDYGATGDGATDDLAAVNLAIAALVAAGRGVLYFPAGTYKTSGQFSTISVPCTILGDGKAGFDGSTGGISRISCTSATAYVFIITAAHALVRELAFDNAAVGTPSAGAAVGTTPTTGLERVDFESCSFEGFWYGLDIQGTAWTVRNCHFYEPIKYGILVRNVPEPDFGDWTITECGFWAGTPNADAAIRIESSGGGKITNCKVNYAGGGKFVTGIDVAIGTGSATIIFLVTNFSIENISGDGIRIVTTGSGTFHQIIITNGQFGLYSNNAGRAVLANGAGISHLLLDNLLAGTDGTARAAIALTNVTDVYIGEIGLTAGFNAVYTNSGVTAFLDNTGAIAAGVRITGTPSAGQVPVASSGNAAAWGAAGSLATDALWDAAGDLVQGTGANTAAKLSAGTAGQVLKSAGAAAANVWSTPGEFATGNTKIATAENTTSTSFADLATAGPSVTVTIGASGKALLHIATRVDNSGDNDNYVGIVISGATTVAAATYMIFHTAAGKTSQMGVTTMITGLNAGSTTFKMQYAVAAGTGSFRGRELTVQPVI